METHDEISEHFKKMKEANEKHDWKKFDNLLSELAVKLEEVKPAGQLWDAEAIKKVKT